MNEVPFQFTPSPRKVRMVIVVIFVKNESEAFAFHTSSSALLCEMPTINMTGKAAVGDDGGGDCAALYKNKRALKSSSLLLILFQSRGN